MGTNRSIDYIKNSIAVISLQSILLIVLLGLLISSPYIEFTHDEYRTYFEQILVYGIPALVILAFVGLLSSNKGLGKNILIFILSILTAFFLFSMIIISLFATGMCSSTDEKIFYQLKKNKSTKIIMRTWGCGATDSSPSVPFFVKTTKYLDLINIVERIDTSKIIKEEWEQVDL